MSTFSIFQTILVVFVVLLIAFVLYSRVGNKKRVNTSSCSATDITANSTNVSCAAHTPCSKDRPIHSLCIESDAQTTGHPLFGSIPPMFVDTHTHIPFYHKPTDLNQDYPPVWVPVNSSIAKVLQDYRPAVGGQDGHGGCTEMGEDGKVRQSPAALMRSQVPPDFSDVFRGYQRLALLSLHLAFGQKHKIIFVHKGNWHKFVPGMSSCVPEGNGMMFGDTLEDTMRLDYVKSYILAHYGGYWFPPDALVVRTDIHQWLNDTVLPRAKAEPHVHLDTPMLVVGGIREVQHGNSTEWFKDDSVLFAEPRNPVMIALAERMRWIVSTSSSQTDYNTRNWFTKALHVYSSPQFHGQIARSVVVLPPEFSGGVDDEHVPVTAEQLFRQRPLDHLPHPETRWLVVDTPDRRITSYPRYEWFAYLTEDAIVQSTLWISMLYRQAIGMEPSCHGRAHQQQGTYRRTVALNDHTHPLRLAWDKSWLVGGCAHE